MKQPKIGLLPLYIKLYDAVWPELRPRIEAFYEKIAVALLEKGIEVVKVPVCRVKSEFSAALTAFEAAGVDAILTLHLAYSPSLEAAGLLAATELPLIILDTTPTFGFGFGQNPDEITYNHGIHGVQDLCNLLKRHGKTFLLEVGHWEKSDVLDRVAGCARAAAVAQQIQKARVGRVGSSFEGMGDFDVAPDILKSTIGIETVAYDDNTGISLIQSVSETEIAAEIDFNKTNYESGGDVADEVQRRSASVNLAIRKWLAKEKLSAFTVNFLAARQGSGLPVMPFLEASKAMARGIGYAGEGDVLTAALVGALLSVYPETSFTEMFCPDWENNRIFLSHMGEMNLNLAEDKPKLAEKDFPFTDAANPVVAYGRFKAGRAAIVNLAPCADNKYSLVVAPVVIPPATGPDSFGDTIRGWFQPAKPIADFLKEYSIAGGTHHCALVYGDIAAELTAFGKIMDWDVLKIE